MSEKPSDEVEKDREAGTNGSDPIEPTVDGEDEALRGLLSSALKDGDEPPPDMVKRVQRTIRKRSKGRFFSDGWSTGDFRANYLLLALIMLVIAFVAYFGLHPSGFQ